MAQEVLGLLGRAVAVEVAGRADHDEPERIGQADLHHVALDGLAEADAGVVAFRDDIDEAILDDYLHLDSRMTRSERR